MEGGLMLELAEAEAEAVELRQRASPSAGELQTEPEPSEEGGLAITDSAGMLLQPTKSRRRSLTELAGKSVGHIGPDAEIKIWLEEILPLWHTDEQLRHSKKVHKLTKKGLPAPVRPMAWTQVVGNTLGLTREMFESQLTAGLAATPTPRERAGRQMIEVDLARTFSADGRFREATWQESLRQVLEAFIHYRPELGYVQGMSFLAAVLLEHTDAGGSGHASGNADAFPAFCALSNLLRPQENRILPILLRLEGPTMDILFTFWDEQLQQSLPRLHAHLEHVGLMPQLYLIEWIFTLFAKSLPPEPVSWIWDQVLLLGDEHIFKMALGLLNLLESKLLAVGDLGEMVSILKELMHSPILFEALLEHASTQSLVFKDPETLKRQRWHSLYASADKMKLKPTLWQQLLADLHALKQQIAASDTLTREANSDVVKLVLALENLDVDEEEARKIASAMQRGRRNAVATLEWGGENPIEAAAQAAAAAAAAAEAVSTPQRNTSRTRRRHSTPDASSTASWGSLSPGCVSDALEVAAQSDESDSDDSVAPIDRASSESPECGSTDVDGARSIGADDGAAAVDARDPSNAAGDVTDEGAAPGSGESSSGKLGGAFRAARRRASMESISMSVPTLGRASLSSVIKRHSRSDTDGLSEGIPPLNGSASNARDAGTAFVMRSLTPELEAMLRRVCSDSPEKSQPADVAQLQAVASKAAIGGPLLVPWLRDHLVHALSTEATAAIIKTLRLLMDLIINSGANQTNFRQRIKADCGGSEGVLAKASQYQPSVSDPHHGEKPATMARRAATQVMALLLGD